MTTIAPSTTIGQIVAERPQLARVFEELKIDYCCGGKRPLGEVCRERGLDAEALVQRLSSNGAGGLGSAEQDWTTAPLTDLCDNIQRTHHDYLRQELPRLTAII